MTTEQDLDYANRCFPNEEAYKIMLEGNLTLPEFVSANRLQMQSLQLSHHVSLLEPETPNLATSFEKPYGKYTDSYYVAPADFRVISVIPKFVNISRFNYLYVVQNMLTKVYDVIEVKHYACLSEDRGYLRPYTDGDKYKPGDIIHKGSTVYRSASHDEYGNYRYGVNPRCAYISLPENEEDGIVIRAGYREKFSFYDMRKTPISINRNQNLLNLYGDDKTYKCFPDIGEEVKDGILYAKRSINYANIAAECTDTSLRHILTNDEVCKGGGVVGDIDIWVNDKEEFEGSENKSQLLKYYRACVDYYTKVYNVLDPIVDAPARNKTQYTRKLRWFFEQARNYLEKNVIWMNNNNNIEFAYIEIFTYEKKYATDGYKITDRYGSKGVITYVCPDEYMPRDELGNVADLILSPPGVIARANPGQLYEQEFNFIAGEVTKRITRLPTIKEKEALLVDFVMTANSDEGIALKSFLKTKNPAEKVQFFKDIEEHDIILCKEPFDGQISPDKLELLYRKYNVAPTPVLICREFVDTMTALPLENVAKAKIDGNYVIPQTEIGFNKRQLDVAGKNKGVTPFDIKKGEKYVNTELAVAPDGNGTFDTIDLYKYRSNAVNNKTAKPGSCVKAWINDQGMLVRQYKSFNPVVIGKKYYILLKQMPDEKFSARSVGSTSQIGVPNKTGKQSKLMSPYAKNAIRLCEMDNDVNFCRIDPEIENRFMATHSVNPELCERLGAMLLTEDPFELHDLDIKNEDIKNNAPALMMHSALYSIGHEINDIYEDDK
jgi:hypothetical protein